MAKSKIQKASGLLEEIFTPLIPGFIIAGLSAGVAELLSQAAPGLGSGKMLLVVRQILGLVNRSFTPSMTAWLGYIACGRFGGTPILGGMLGMLTGLSEIDALSEALGLRNVLFKGAGGVVAAFLGAFLVARLEKLIRRKMPRSLDMVLTPLLSMLLVVAPYILLIMPLAGFVSQGLRAVIELLSAGGSVLTKIISGFLCAAAFLPINVGGLQYSIIALYPIQLEKYGRITLYPVFAMAGAGQVGAGLAVGLLASIKGNKKLSQIAFSSSVPGMLGVATPLLYGVVLPRPKAFLSACLGAGIGGAFIMSMGVVSTGWGPSGLLAIPMMAGGGASALASMGIYAAGLALSAAGGFAIALALLGSADI